MKILLLGGSQFMGLETLKLLTQMPVELTVVNRGKQYWIDENSIPEFDKIPKTFTHVKSDWENREKFWEDIRKVSNEWDYVIDFSCLKARHMRTIIEAGFSIGTYIYVSTDSVYEVTEANYTKESLDKV